MTNTIKALVAGIIVLACALVLTLVLTLGHAAGGGINTNSQSYSDGYHDNDPSASCQASYGAPLTGPSGDNYAEYMAGCEASQAGLPYGSVPNG